MTYKSRLDRRSGKSRYSVVLLIFTALCFTTVLVSAADSDLDPTFDGDGIVITNQGAFEQINDIVIQPDGKILAAGHAGTFTNSTQEPLNIRVVRYNTDGSLDATFGNGGLVTTAIGTYAKAWAITLQADGKILIAGRSGTISESSFTIVRYNPNGSLDPTFGGTGIVTTAINFFSQARAITTQPDGKIVVSGEAVLTGVGFIATLARYNPDGSLDSSFDGDGISQQVPAGLQGSPPAATGSIALQSDQKILISGLCPVDSTLKLCVSRYNSGGLLDATFDGDGVVVTDFESTFASLATTVVIQPDGKIVAAGQGFTPTGTIPVLARYLSDGSLDTSFDGDGRVTTPNSIQFEPADLALQSNGKLVIAGRAFITQPPFQSVFIVARYDPNGALDATFGTGGIVTTSFGVGAAAASAIAVHADDRIVAAGYANFAQNGDALLSDFALVRYGMAGDQSSGSVAGGGWIDSPPGALVSLPAASGRANFALTARSRDALNAPVGNTRFQFKAGGLNFQSTSYEWLVIAGNKAQYLGTGTINGDSSYRFKLTCIDGDRAGGDGRDRFRIRIWNAGSFLVYDSQPNAADSADPSTVVGGGNIVIHD